MNFLKADNASSKKYSIICNIQLGYPIVLTVAKENWYDFREYRKFEIICFARFEGL